MGWSRWQERLDWPHGYAVAGLPAGEEGKGLPLGRYKSYGRWGKGETLRL